MNAALGSDALRERKIRNWLLALLRFAVTRESPDRLAVLTAADDLDASGAKGSAVPRFFTRSSKEVCEAIMAPGDQCGHDVLRRHAERIDDPRLRTAGQITASSFARNREPSCDRHTPSDSVIPPGVLRRAFEAAVDLT
jgi:hypothetical protein